LPTSEACQGQSAEKREVTIMAKPLKQRNSPSKFVSKKTLVLDLAERTWAGGTITTSLSRSPRSLRLKTASAIMIPAMFGGFE
jgi:hypothetical protein